MSGLLAVLSLGSRLGLAGGALYGTHQLGVWGDAKQGEKVYNSLISGELKDSLLADCPLTEHLPSLPDTGLGPQLETVSRTLGESRENFFGLYNSAVLGTIKGISDLPETSKFYVNQAVEAVQEASK